MIIKRATKENIDGINNLLYQVLSVHHEGRPDIFKGGVKKYTNSELEEIIKNDQKPIFVAVEDDKVLGYAFCVFIQYTDDNILTNIKTLYIDDLCVDEKERGKHIGKALFDYVKEFATKEGFYNVTLNVWALNEGAVAFYEKCGMHPLKYGMEILL